MTGAPLPKGADTVLKVEDTEHTADSVRVFKPEQQGANVRPQGEDVKKGECIIGKGTRIRPGEAGMLAILAKSFIFAYQRPRVAILSTGDELADLDERFSEEKIINSNSYGIAAAVQEAGGIPLLLGIARDTPAALKDKISQGLTADILVLSGGVSMGDYDFTKAVFHELGAAHELLEVSDQAWTAACLRQDSGQAGFRLAGESRVLHGDVRTTGSAGHAQNERAPELWSSGRAGDFPGEVFQTDGSASLSPRGAYTRRRGFQGSHDRGAGIRDIDVYGEGQLFDRYPGRGRTSEPG